MAREGTYSIVARDPQTGELGVAVQSHWFAVGALVTWAAPGVGAVATQAVVDAGYGPALLDALRAGDSAAQALGRRVAADDAADFRQVAVIGAIGAPAVHTGGACIAFAGHDAGADHCAQANIMASAAVWPAMSRAFAAARGPLGRRLLAALRGGEAAGGDVRGRQSAALVVVPPAGETWRAVVDVRIEDHPEPLDELERLLGLNDAYTLAGRGDDLTAQGRHDEAGRLYRQAAQLAPEKHELVFWAGVSAFQNGDREEGLAAVRRALAVRPGLRDLLGRLPPDVAPAAAAVLEALGDVS
jgi:uncharacterized Ntn-hydrolase superfamily protein